MEKYFAVLTCCLSIFSVTEASCDRQYEYNVANSICEKLTLRKCKSLGYQKTALPNLVHQRSQRKAGIFIAVSGLTGLIDTECSRYILPFTCSIFAPPCTYAKFALPPCKRLCERAQSGCQEFLEMMDMKWPRKLCCDQFPEPGTKVLCIDWEYKQDTDSYSMVIKGNATKADIPDDTFRN